MLHRDEAMEVLNLILNELEANWPGEYPRNRLQYLNFKGWDLGGEEMAHIAA